VINSEVSGLHAYVVYENAEIAEAASAALDASHINGASVSSKVAAARRRNRRRGAGAGAAGGEDAPVAGGRVKKAPTADPARIWVGNLPAEVEPEAVTGAFSQFGEVARFQRRNPESRFCFLTFVDAGAAQAAVGATIALQGETLEIQQSTAARIRTDRVRNTRPNRRQVPQE
jgi:hypothetical protein